MEIPTEAGALVRNDNVVRGALPSANSNLPCVNLEIFNNF